MGNGVGGCGREEEEPEGISGSTMERVWEGGVYPVAGMLSSNLRVDGLMCAGSFFYWTAHSIGSAVQACWGLSYTIPCAAAGERLFL